jgi:hypothetical protein
VKPERSNVRRSSCRVSRLGDDESTTGRPDGEPARTATPVGRRQRVAQEATATAAAAGGELEDAVAVGVGDEDVAGVRIDGDAVRTLELTLPERFP